VSSQAGLNVVVSVSSGSKLGKTANPCRTFQGAMYDLDLGPGKQVAVSLRL
jgi:hypothetical protein